MGLLKQGDAERVVSAKVITLPGVPAVHVGAS